MCVCVCHHFLKLRTCVSVPPSPLPPTAEVGKGWGGGGREGGREGGRGREEGIGVGGGKEVGEGGRVERKEEGEIGLQAIVYKFSYVMEVFMRGGDGHFIP